LPAWVGFKGGSNPNWQPKDTTVWPVQKFGWRDFAASRGQTYTYDIVPVTGSPTKLTQVTDKTLTTNSVTLTPKRGSFSTYFTNGILATQALTHVVPAGASGTPNPTVLQGHIDQPGDPLRMKLAGQVLEGMTMLLDRAAQQGGACYCALYELSDPELVDRLLKAKAYLHIILSNTGATDTENQPAREKLHAAGIDITDRMVANGHIGHNKFCLYVDGTGQPRAVLTGSTNWTPTGLCTQSNNATVIESNAVAEGYFEYWKRLKADGSAQGQPLRTADRTTPVNANVDTATVKIWYSPNTQQTTKPANGATPVDMQDVFAAMAQAKHAILFLVFQPGNPSIVEYAAACEDAKPGLLVYGAATDPNASNNFKTVLFHRTTKDQQVVADDVVSAAAVPTQFGYWHKELLKMPGAHAIIHDKIVVIDPTSSDCIVIFGSHNQGYRASYNNDENMVIVKGHQLLAQSYATHVMDVYDHYRWRYTLNQSASGKNALTGLKNAFTGLDPTDGWQDKYFAANSSAYREALFWTGQLPALPAAPAPAVPKTQAVSNAKLTKGAAAKGAAAKPAKARGGRTPAAQAAATASPAKRKTKRKGARKQKRPARRTSRRGHKRKVKRKAA
jgi:phosphatidylserine/phosphatidylglycerophosphate/cardiolipin synthase-like enzyme